MKEEQGQVVPMERIESRILVIRGQKVMLDSDLAELYGVETKVLLQAVRRNRGRFPSDFVFVLTKEELECLRSQTVTSKGRGGRRHSAYALTEQGVAMLSSVLRSDRAVEVSVEIMRAFVRLRRVLAAHVDLARIIHESLLRGHQVMSGHRCGADFDPWRSLMLCRRSKSTPRLAIQALATSRDEIPE